MSISELAKSFFRVIDEKVGPFDRPIQFRPFPFDAGGALNFLTVSDGHKDFVTYVSWDLFGHPEQKRGALGRYELIATCNEEKWCLDILTNIGRQGLQAVFEPGDTLDITPWVKPGEVIQGIIFEEAFKTELHDGLEPCGLLRCIGVTRPELEFAVKEGIAALIERLKCGGIYPRTITQRESVDLSVKH